MTLHIGITAGEPSGDLLGAGVLDGLAAATTARGLDLRVTGVGGERMAAAGLEQLFPMADLTVHGFTQPLARLPALWRRLGELEAHFRAAPPAAFLGVDFNVFNGLLERRLKRAGIPTAHYVSPSVYAWRRGRARKMARKVDLLLTLFPFEPPFYAGTGVRAVCVGHPLADSIPVQQDHAAERARARTVLGVPEGAPVLAMLPGSRRGELAQLLAPFVAAASLLAQRQPGLVVLVPAATAALGEVLEAALAATDLDARVLVDGSRAALTACDVALVKAGTATLETLLLRRPMVVAYRLGAVTHAIARQLVFAEHFALPNILAGKTLVPEFIQAAVTPEALAGALLTAFEQCGGPLEAQLLGRFAELHADLARDASARAAEALLQLAGQG